MVRCSWHDRRHQATQGLQLHTQPQSHTAHHVAAPELRPALSRDELSFRLRHAAEPALVQVTEGKGKLQGSARVGEQQLPPPEVDAGKGLVAARTVSWRLVHRGTCYLLCLHVLKRFSCSQVTLNGFIVHSKQHSIWDQVGGCKP